MGKKTNSVVPAPSTNVEFDGFTVDSKGRLVLSPESDIHTLPCWELSDNDLKMLWMYEYRNPPELLAEEMEKWPTRDLHELRASLKRQAEEFLDEDQEWQARQDADPAQSIAEED